MIIFEEVSTLGRGDYIKVKKLGRVGPNHSPGWGLENV